MFTVSVVRRPLFSLVLVTVVTVVGVGHLDLVTELPRLRAVLDVPLLQASTPPLYLSTAGYLHVLVHVLPHVVLHDLLRGTLVLLARHVSHV